MAYVRTGRLNRTAAAAAAAASAAHKVSVTDSGRRDIFRIVTTIGS